MKKKHKNTIYWLLLAAAGVILILGNRMAQNIMGKVIAAALLLAAVSGIISWAGTKSKAPEALARVVGYIVTGGIGIWALVQTGSFITFLNVVLGLIMIILGVVNFWHAWKKDKDTITMVLAAAGMILGLIIACNNAATTWMTIVEGIGLIYTALIGMCGERK